MSSIISRGSSRSSRTTVHDPSSVVLDFSKKKIAVIQDLSRFSRLQILDLSNNNLESVDGIDTCRELWFVNLSNNKLQCLDGFSNFVALGTLALANNQLTWRSLSTIQHLHIIHLIVQGNPAISNDKHSHEHLVDSFPNVWLLDGKFISAYERIQNRLFFQRRVLGQNPLWHKFKKDNFVPSSRKNIRVNGVFGSKATNLMINFPVNAAHNIDLDKRRLRYLSRVFEEDIVQFAEHSNRDQKIFHDSPSFLMDLVELHDSSNEQKDVCNMLTLLLLCSLEFALPTHLLKETLETMRLTRFGTIPIFNLFLLPKELRCVVAQVMFACTTLSFHTKTSSLQEHLFVAMRSSITELTKISVTLKGDDSYLALSKLNRVGMSSYKSLLASELVYQMCLVPYFYEVLSELSVVYLLSMASGDVTLAERLITISQQEQQRGEDMSVIYDIQSALICRAVNKHVAFLIRKFNKGAKRAVRDQLPVSRLEPQPLFSSTYLTSGRTPPNQRPSSVASNLEPARIPELGEEILIGPQNVGRVIAVPDSGLVQVQMLQVPVPNGGMCSFAAKPEEHYTYIDIKEIEWDAQKQHWKPKGSIGDKITFQMENSDTPRHNEPIIRVTVTSEPAVHEPQPRPLSAVMLQHHPAEMVRLFDKTGDEQFLEEISRSLQELRVPAGRNSPTDAASEQTIEDHESSSVGEKRDSVIEKSNLPVISETPTNEETDHPQSQTESVQETPKNGHTEVSVIAAERNPRKDLVSEENLTKRCHAEVVKSTELSSSTKSQSGGHTRYLSAGSHDNVPQHCNTSIMELKVPNIAATRLANDQSAGQSPSIESYRQIGRNNFFDENISAYQRQRAEAWRAKTYGGADTPKNEDLFRPKRGFRLARKEAGQWLGNGRDLFAEEQSKRPAPNHSPGWKQNHVNISARRTLRRGEVPMIHTPSSLLYDCYCRHPPTQVIFGDEHQVQELHMPGSLPTAPTNSSEYRTTRRLTASPRPTTAYGYVCYSCQEKQSLISP